MDAAEIRRWGRELDQYLASFASCFGRKDTRAHLGVYVRGQLSNLKEKSVEPIALEFGVAVRTLQEFLSQLRWAEDFLRDRLQQTVANEHGGPHSIGLIDETADPKKGDKTPGVQKQWCGRLGKVENCMVTVHLGFARDDFQCLLDGELYLPESWAADRKRCKEAGIPDTMTYRPKWQIALELYDRAMANGVVFEWLTFDEGYGCRPEFLRALSARNQCYVGEVPRKFFGWLNPPKTTDRPFRLQGQGRNTPRLVAGSPRPRRVDELLEDEEMRAKPWQRIHVKDTEKGPSVWEYKHEFITVRGEDGLPGERLHLIVARDVLNQETIKYFVSNADPKISIEPLLLVAFSRWRIERCFQDEKTEIGLDQYEGRRYIGLKRHLILSTISHLFLARVRQKAEKKLRTDRMPSTHRDLGRHSHVGSKNRRHRRKSVHPRCRDAGLLPTTKPPGPQEPHEANHTRVTTSGHPNQRTETVRMGRDLAL
jgi:SRSO17 transposase